MALVNDARPVVWPELPDAYGYTTEVFETDAPWPVRVDLPALTAKRARMFD